MSMMLAEERRLLYRLLLLSFLIGGGIVFADTAANAQFVATVGAAQLPLTYIIASVAVIITGFLYTRSQRYLTLRQLIAGVMFILLLGTIIVWVGLTFFDSVPLVYGGLVWFRHVKMFGEIAFWTAAGSLLTLSQGKRMFGIVSTGKVLAEISAYFAVPLLVRGIGNVNLLLLSASLLGAATVLLLSLLRDYTAKVHTDEAQMRKTPSRYVWLIYLIVGLPAIGFFLIGFNFYTQAGIRFESAEQLAAFFGIFAGVMSIVVLLVNATMSARVLQRYGLVSVLAIRPIVLLLLTLPMIFAGNTVTLMFVLAMAMRFSDTLLYGSTHRPASAMLYQPLSPDVRVRVQGVAEGIVIALALGIAGVMLLVVGPDRVNLNAVLIIFVMACMLMALIALARAYPKTLQRALHKRFLTDAPFGLVFAPPTTAGADPLTTQLEQTLKDATVVLAAREAISEPLLFRAINENLTGIEDRVFELLATRYEPQTVRQVRDNLYLVDKRDIAVELGETLLSAEHRQLFAPLLRYHDGKRRLRDLSARFDTPERDETEWIRWLLTTKHIQPFSEWVQLVAAHVAQNTPALKGIAPKPDAQGGLPLVEKVTTLRNVSLFATTPDHILAQVGALLDEVSLHAGETIFEQGDLGTSMYIIVKGQMRAHADGHTLNYLNENDVFGEMAVLDPEARVASISAETDTLLLKLDQGPLFELMELRPEVSRGIIRVLSRHLRARVADINEIRQQKI
jgi:hypothetical protein